MLPGARWLRRYSVWTAAVFAAAFASGWIVLERLDERTWDLPFVRSISLAGLYARPAPIGITTTADWLKVPVMAAPNAIRSDPELWRRMHFDDWDTVPLPLRREGLEHMVKEYGHLLRAPRRWDRMTPADWDAVPQPMRAMAFMNMMRYWSGYYQVGASHGLPRGVITDTLNAIMLVESWFEHRAVSTSRSGNRDFGLGQASDYARDTMARLARVGLIDFAPQEDAGYFDPWQATRMTAIWLDLMIDEQGGDLNGAIRAYHRGTPRADTEAGDAYLSNVLRKRRRFIREGTGTPAWELLIGLT